MRLPLIRPPDEFWIAKWRWTIPEYISLPCLFLVSQAIVFGKENRLWVVRSQTTFPWPGASASLEGNYFCSRSPKYLKVHQPGPPASQVWCNKPDGRGEDKSASAPSLRRNGFTPFQPQWALVDLNVCFEIWNTNSVGIDNVSLSAGCKQTAGEKGTVMSKWTPRLTIDAVERTPFGLWVHLEWMTALYVLFNVNTLDWLMMVEGLPLGLLMQCYHTLSIFLSGGGRLSFRSLSYCHHLLLSLSSSFRSLFSFSVSSVWPCHGFSPSVGS